MSEGDSKERRRRSGSGGPSGAFVAKHPASNCGQWLLMVPMAVVLLGYVGFPSLRLLWVSLHREGAFTLENYLDFFSSRHP